MCVYLLVCFVVVYDLNGKQLGKYYSRFSLALSIIIASGFVNVG